MEHLILLHVVCLPLAFGVPSLYSPQIIIRSGSAFSQHVIPNNDERVTACLLQYSDPQSNVTKRVGIKLNGIQEFDKIGLQSRLSNLGRGMCGFTLKNFTTKDPTNFIILIDYEDRQTKQSLELAFEAYCSGLNDQYPLGNVTRNFRISDSTVITCSHPNEKRFACMLHNPNDELVAQGKENCDYSIQHISTNDIGTWRCSLSLLYSMQHFESFVTLRLKDKPKVDVWYKEKNAFGMIGCKYNNVDASPPDFCLLTNPENTVFTISDKSSSTGRYTSLGTNLEKLTCQIEFPLPILPEEKGIWKCAVGPTGGFINTDEVNTQITIKDQIQYAELDSEIEIKCFVPYSAETCIITSPDGKAYYGGNVEPFHLGQCRAKIEKFQPSQIGTWACRFSRANVAVDDIMKVEVKVAEGKSGFPEIEVTGGGSAELKCKFDSPIYFCTFLDPLGNSYNVHPDKTTDETEYIGTGLENGDCGIKIKSIRSDQAGEWRCIATNSESSSDILELKTRMIVDTGFVATASSIGIPVSIMVIAVVFLGLALCKRFVKFKRVKHRTSDGSASSNLPFTANANIATYNT